MHCILFFSFVWSYNEGTGRRVCHWPSLPFINQNLIHCKIFTSNEIPSAKYHILIDFCFFCFLIFPFLPAKDWALPIVLYKGREDFQLVHPGNGKGNLGWLPSFHLNPWRATPWKLPSRWRQLVLVQESPTCWTIRPWENSQSWKGPPSSTEETEGGK